MQKNIRKKKHLVKHELTHFKCIFQKSEEIVSPVY